MRATENIGLENAKRMENAGLEIVTTCYKSGKYSTGKSGNAIARICRSGNCGLKMKSQRGIKQERLSSTYKFYEHYTIKHRYKSS